jgi:ribonuclease BN (tRNA processing enzyme)
VQVTDTEEIVELAYTGDTLFAPLLQEPLLCRARTVIMECTYLEDGDEPLAHKYQHVHLKVGHLFSFIRMNKGSAILRLEGQFR